MLARWKYLFIIIGLILGIGLLLAYCRSNAEKVASTSASEPAAASGAAEESASGSPSGQLNISGSSAMLPLFQAAAEQYQMEHPDVKIALTGGGSGAGRSQVCAGDVQIGNSDVAMTEQEMTDMSCAEAINTTVCIQGFVVIANPEGPGDVTDLTQEQLQGIFGGTITNWSEVGGDDAAIAVINRPRGSGTRQVMADYLYEGDDAQFTTGVSEEKENETVYTTISQTPNTISYLGFAYAGREGIVVFSLDGASAAEATIQDGSWPIADVCYSYTKGEPSDLTKQFLDWMTSDDFQDQPIFQTTGFVPIPADQRSGD